MNCTILRSNKLGMELRTSRLVSFVEQQDNSTPFITRLTIKTKISRILETNNSVFIQIRSRIIDKQNRFSSLFSSIIITDISP